MNTKTISDRAISVIDQYVHFKWGNAVCSIPYFNNKTIRARAALRTFVGKGSPKDIFDEIQNITVKNHISPDSLADEALKKILVDNNIGIECSGFAYYVLNAENHEMNKGDLSKKLSFPNCRSIIGKIRCFMRPVENCDVATFAHDKNSKVVSLSEIKPADIITMTPMISGYSLASEFSPNDRNERDHILVIHQVEYQNFVPTKIHYSHAIAYPEDGLYNHGVRQGVISITDIKKPVSEQSWSEEGKEGAENRLFTRAQKSKTEIRRMNWF